MPHSDSPAPARFPTTRRSVVTALASGEQEERERAFATIVSLYWKPLYKYARWRTAAADAEDLTQGFFTRALETESLAVYDPDKASFRTFLRMLFDRYAVNVHKSDTRQKRGGDAIHLDFASAEKEIGLESQHSSTPEECYEREWVRSIFAVSVSRLRDALSAEGKETHFAIFEAYDLNDDAEVSYSALAKRFALTETTVTNHLAATRRRFRAIVLDLLRESTATDHEYRREARALLGVDG